MWYVTTSRSVPRPTRYSMNHSSVAALAGHQQCYGNRAYLHKDDSCRLCSLCNRTSELVGRCARRSRIRTSTKQFRPTIPVKRPIRRERGGLRRILRSCRCYCLGLLTPATQNDRLDGATERVDRCGGRKRAGNRRYRDQVLVNANDRDDLGSYSRECAPHC